MFKHMGIISTFGLILGFALGSPAYAADQMATGRVNKIAGFDSASTFSDAIELTGVSSLGACATDSSTGLVIFRFAVNTGGTNPSNDRIYAVLFASYTQGKTVTIDTNDSSGLLNGDCTINYVSLNPI
jgi:hypothetical protein